MGGVKQTVMGIKGLSNTSVPKASLADVNSTFFGKWSRRRRISPERKNAAIEEANAIQSLEMTSAAAVRALEEGEDADVGFEQLDGAVENAVEKAQQAINVAVGILENLGLTEVANTLRGIADQVEGIL